MIVTVIATKIVVSTVQQRAPIPNPPTGPLSTSTQDGNALVFAWKSPKTIVGIKKSTQHANPKTVTTLNPIVSLRRTLDILNTPLIIAQARRIAIITRRTNPATKHFWTYGVVTFFR